MKRKTITLSAALAAITLSGVILVKLSDDENEQTTPSNTRSRDRHVASGDPGSLRTKREKPHRLAGLSIQELAKLLPSVLMITDDNERFQALRDRLGMDISEEAYRKALAKLGHQVDPERFFEALMAEWMEDDPGKVTLWIDGLPEPLRTKLLKEAVMAWMAADESAALAWAKKHMDPDELDRLQGSLESFIEQQKQRNWSSSDAASTVTGMHETYREMKTRLDGMLAAWQLKHPDQSIDQAADLSGMPDAQYERLIFKLLEHRSAENPAAAMEYALGIKDPGIQDKAVATVMERWAAKSTAEAKQWLEAQPKGDLRDAAMVELVRATAKTDLTAARQLIETVDNPELKVDAMHAALVNRQAVASQLPEALRIMNGLPQLDPATLTFLSTRIAPEDTPIYRACVEKSHSEGRIQFSSSMDARPQDPTNPDQVRAAMEMNEREHAESYQRLLREIDQQGLEGRE